MVYKKIPSLLFTLYLSKDEMKFSTFSVLLYAKPFYLKISINKVKISKHKITRLKT